VDDIICGAKDALSLAVLLRGVWTRHTQGNAFGKKESARGRVIKLMAVIALDGFYGAPKLSGDIGEKIRESGKSVGFEAKWESP